MTASGLVGVALMMLALTQGDSLREYVDPGGRFRFSYPAAFGPPSPGTDNGFNDRVSCIQAGGLYDAIALQIFPEPLRQRIVRALTPLTVSNFCQQIAQEQHLDPQDATLAGLTAQQKAAITSTDRMRNMTPRAISAITRIRF